MATIVTRAGKGSALTFVEGDANFNNLNTAKLENVVEDTTPQLGGNLDIQSNTITTSTTNGNIQLSPNGVGLVFAATNKFMLGHANQGSTITTNGTGNLLLNTTDGTNTGSIEIKSGVTGHIEIRPATGAAAGSEAEVKLFGVRIKVGNDQNTGNTSIGTPSGNLRLTGQISPTGGSEIVLNGGANGSITLTPKGTGGVNQIAGNFTVSAGAVFGQALVSNRNSHITGSQISMFQSHATADANNFGMFRTRGTNTVQAAVQSGDELMEIVVGGNDGSATTNAGLKFAFGMTTTMTDAPTTGFMPARTDFFVNTAGTVVAAMSMASDRVVRVAELGTVSGVTNLTISAGTDGNITLAPNGTGKTVVNNITFFSTPHALTFSATIEPNVAQGMVQIVTLTDNVTFNEFNTPVSGQTLTLIVKQDATGSRTLTSTMLFAGGSKTLSTAANSIDKITVLFDGTNYLASLQTNFS